MVEHDKVMFDLHGLALEVEETEELIQTSLAEMEKELQQIKKKPSFDKAMKLNHESCKILRNKGTKMIKHEKTSSITQ